MSHALLVSDEAWERHGARFRAAAPGVEPVLLRLDRPVTATELEQVRIAAFTADLYPDRAGEFMKAALSSPNLRWLHTYSTGTDHPVFGSFLARGCRLTNSAGSSATPIAHTVLLYLLALSRDLPGWTRSQLRSEWSPHRVEDLEGATVAVIGMGPIGTEVARLATACGMTVIGCRRSPNGDEPCPTWPLARIDELLGLADWVVLALPLTDDTRGILDARRLALLRPTARVVNVGRGELVDEPALVAALQSGALAGAALDVTVVEPLPADSPLWSMPNVIITPHSSGASDVSSSRALDVFVDNLARWATDRPLRNEVHRAGVPVVEPPTRP